MSHNEKRRRMPKKEAKVGMVRFNLYLPREVYDALEELRTRTGKGSIAETIRSALKVYDLLNKGDKEVVVRDPKTKHEERLIPV